MLIIFNFSSNLDKIFFFISLTKITIKSIITKRLRKITNILKYEETNSI